MTAKITQARILLPLANPLGAVLAGRWDAQLDVTLDDGTEMVRVVAWYPDELTFTEQEFIGLTIDEARSLVMERDVEYLKS
jgi:hypothetical protein